MQTPEYQLESPKRRRPIRLIVLVSLLGLVIGLPFVVRRVDRNDFYPYGDSCQFNLKMLCLASNMYAEDHGGAFPELSPKPGALALREDKDYPGIYPYYLTEINFLTCPSARVLRPRARWFGEDPPPPPELNEVSSDRCYFYLGYLIPDQETLEYFSEAYRARIAAEKPFDEDLSLVNDNGVSLRIPRLRKDIPGITDTKEGQSTIPVFIERFPKGHIPGGAYVLYLDGHVDFIKWGAKWPMTPEAMDVLLALDALGNLSPATPAEAGS